MTCGRTPRTGTCVPPSQARLSHCRLLVMNSTSSSSPLRRGWGAGLQVPTLSSQNGLFDDQPHPEATSKNGLIRTKDPPITQEIPRGFRSSVSRTRDKNQKDTFLLYHSYPKGLESNLLGHYLQISTLLRNT